MGVPRRPARRRNVDAEPGAVDRSPRQPSAHSGSTGKPVRATTAAGAAGAAPFLALPASNRSASSTIATLQRQVAPAPPAMDVAEFIDDREAPGLTAAIGDRVRDAMRANRRQEAVTLIVDYLIANGQIDPAILRGGRMRYDGTLNQEGAATIPGFRVIGGRRVAFPTRVRIGRTAFGRGLPWLYSSIIHEYRHVVQFQETYSAGTRPMSGQQDWQAPRQEADAYIHEILNSRTTGMFNNPAQMRETWNRLQFNHWINVDQAGRRALNDGYVRAHEIAQEAVGPGVRLGFSPARP